VTFSAAVYSVAVSNTRDDVSTTGAENNHMIIHYNCLMINKISVAKFLTKVVTNNALES